MPNPDVMSLSELIASQGFDKAFKAIGLPGVLQDIVQALTEREPFFCDALTGRMWDAREAGFDEIDAILDSATGMTDVISTVTALAYETMRQRMRAALDILENDQNSSVLRFHAWEMVMKIWHTGFDTHMSEVGGDPDQWDDGAKPVFFLCADVAFDKSLDEDTRERALIKARQTITDLYGEPDEVFPKQWNDRECPIPRRNLDAAWKWLLDRHYGEGAYQLLVAR
ncbi:hypothetical protein IPM44_00225 [bacterium]|nr:MAG: hypothetical protein IPM44_00225 [bacterium]